MHELLISEKQKCIKIVLLRFSAEGSKQPLYNFRKQVEFLGGLHRWKKSIAWSSVCKKKALLMGPLIVFNHNSFIFGIFEKVYNFIN